MAGLQHLLCCGTDDPPRGRRRPLQRYCPTPAPAKFYSANTRRPESSALQSPTLRSTSVPAAHARQLRACLPYLVPDKHNPTRSVHLSRTSLAFHPGDDFSPAPIRHSFGFLSGGGLIAAGTGLDCSSHALLPRLCGISSEEGDLGGRVPGTWVVQVPPGLAVRLFAAYQAPLAGPDGDCD